MSVDDDDDDDFGKERRLFVSFCIVLLLLLLSFLSLCFICFYGGDSIQHNSSQFFNNLGVFVFIHALILYYSQPQRSGVRVYNQSGVVCGIFCRNYILFSFSIVSSFFSPPHFEILP